MNGPEIATRRAIRKFVVGQDWIIVWLSTYAAAGVTHWYEIEVNNVVQGLQYRSQDEAFAVVDGYLDAWRAAKSKKELLDAARQQRMLERKGVHQDGYGDW